MQSVQVELAALVQVRADSQPSTDVQVVHTVGTVADFQNPLSHAEHTELVAVEQVSVPLQWSTLVQAWHCEQVESEPVVQVSWPGAQCDTGAQKGQLSA